MKSEFAYLGDTCVWYPNEDDSVIVTFRDPDNDLAFLHELLTLFVSEEEEGEYPELFGQADDFDILLLDHLETPALLLTSGLIRVDLSLTWEELEALRDATSGNAIEAMKDEWRELPGRLRSGTEAFGSLSIVTSPHAIEGATMEIYDYMVQRAAFENKEHTLQEQYYRDALRQGCRSFFKVLVNDEGDVLRDKENMAFFKKWKEQK